MLIRADVSAANGTQQNFPGVYTFPAVGSSESHDNAFKPSRIMGPCCI